MKTTPHKPRKKPLFNVILQLQKTVSASQLKTNIFQFKIKILLEFAKK